MNMDNTEVVSMDLETSPSVHKDSSGIGTTSNAPAVQEMQADGDWNKKRTRSRPGKKQRLANRAQVDSEGQQDVEIVLPQPAAPTGTPDSSKIHYDLDMTKRKKKPGLETEGDSVGMSEASKKKPSSSETWREPVKFTVGGQESHQENENSGPTQPSSRENMNVAWNFSSSRIGRKTLLQDETSVAYPPQYYNYSNQQDYRPRGGPTNEYASSDNRRKFRCEICHQREPNPNETFRQHLETRNHRHMKALLRNRVWPAAHDGSRGSIAGSANQIEPRIYRMTGEGTGIYCLSCHVTCKDATDLLLHQLLPGHYQAVDQLNHMMKTWIPVIYYCHVCDIVFGSQEFDGGMKYEHHMMTTPHQTGMGEAPLYGSQAPEEVDISDLKTKAACVWMTDEILMWNQKMLDANKKYEDTLMMERANGWPLINSAKLKLAAESLQIKVRDLVRAAQFGHAGRKPSDTNALVQGRRGFESANADRSGRRSDKTLDLLIRELKEGSGESLESKMKVCLLEQLIEKQKKNEEKMTELMKRLVRKRKVAYLSEDEDSDEKDELVVVNRKKYLEDLEKKKKKIESEIRELIDDPSKRRRRQRRSRSRSRPRDKRRSKSATKESTSKRKAKEPAKLQSELKLFEEELKKEAAQVTGVGELVEKDKTGAETAKSGEKSKTREEDPCKDIRSLAAARTKVLDAMERAGKQKILLHEEEVFRQKLHEEEVIKQKLAPEVEKQATCDLPGIVEDWDTVLRNILEESKAKEREKQNLIQTEVGPGPEVVKPVEAPRYLLPTPVAGNTQVPMAPSSQPIPSPGLSYPTPIPHQPQHRDFGGLLSSLRGALATVEAAESQASRKQPLLQHSPSVQMASTSWAGRQESSRSPDAELSAKLTIALKRMLEQNTANPSTDTAGKIQQILTMNPSPSSSGTLPLSYPPVVTDEQTRKRVEISETWESLEVVQGEEDLVLYWRREVVIRAVVNGSSGLGIRNGTLMFFQPYTSSKIVLSADPAVVRVNRGEKGLLEFYIPVSNITDSHLGGDVLKGLKLGTVRMCKAVDLAEMRKKRRIPVIDPSSLDRLCAVEQSLSEWEMKELFDWLRSIQDVFTDSENKDELLPDEDAIAWGCFNHPSLKNYAAEQKLQLFWIQWHYSSGFDVIWSKRIMTVDVEGEEPGTVKTGMDYRDLNAEDSVHSKQHGKYGTFHFVLPDWREQLLAGKYFSLIRIACGHVSARIARLIDQSFCVLGNRILVISSRFDTHIGRLRNLFFLLRDWGVRVMPEECFFAKSSVEFLGFVFADQSISPDQELINLMDLLPVPTTYEEAELVVNILFCFKFMVFGFNEIVQPLKDFRTMFREDRRQKVLSRRSAKLRWTRECEYSLEKLKRKIRTAEALILPDYEKPLIIETYFYSKSEGANLLQLSGNGFFGPVERLSKVNSQYKSAEQCKDVVHLEVKLIAYILEQSSILKIIKQCRQPCIVYTSPAAIHWLSNSDIDRKSNVLTKEKDLIRSFDLTLRDRAMFRTDCPILQSDTELSISKPISFQDFMATSISPPTSRALSERSGQVSPPFSHCSFEGGARRDLTERRSPGPPPVDTSNEERAEESWRRDESWRSYGEAELNDMVRKQLAANEEESWRQLESWRTVDSRPNEESYGMSLSHEVDHSRQIMINPPEKTVYPYHSNF